MVKSLVFGALLLVSGILLGMWIRTPGDQGPENQRSSDPPNISEAVAAVDEPTAPGSHEEGFLGVVLPTEAVDVAAETDGRLESVEVRVGDQVQKDDRIATIDTRSLERDLQMAEAALRALEADRQQVRTALASAIDRLERRIGSPDLFPAEELAEAQFRKEAAEGSVQATEARIEEAGVRVDQLREAKDDADVRAPFDGVVSMRHLDAGATVNRGTPLVRLLKDGPLSVRFALPGDRAGSLDVVGDQVRIAIEGLDTSVLGTVATIAPEIDVAAGVILVEARIDSGAPSGNRIQAGAVARVVVEGPTP